MRITSAGQIAVAGAGTAAAPVITKNDDLNTGIFFPAADTIAFAEGGSEAARIDSSGRLLVGTSSSRSIDGSERRVQIEGVGPSNTQLSIIRHSNDAAGANIYLTKSRGTAVGSSTLVSALDDLGGIFFAGFDGTQSVVGVGILASADATPGANSMPGRLSFRTATNAAPSVLTEQMVIDSAGGLRFNSGFGSAAPAFGCRAWVFFDAAGGTITVQGSGGVSSVTRDTAGVHTVNLSTTMPDTAYCVNVTSGTSFTGHSSSNTSTTATVVETRAVATPHDPGDAGRNMVTIHR
jgi:hypothetical protein